MLGWIVRSSLRFRLLVVALGAAVLAAGAHQSQQMSVDSLPEFAPPMIEVQTEALGLSAPEVEDLVTLNLEELLNGTPWLQNIHSTSVPGLSSILLTFEPGTDVLRARQLVQERLALSFAIPNVAKPPVIIQPLSTTNRVMMIGLESNTISPIEMGILARWNIRPALLAVPGVANVSIWGQRERQLQVQVQPERLLANHITLDQIVRTTGNAMWVSPLTFLQASTPGSGGWIDTPQQRLEVRHIFPITTADDLSKVAVDGAGPIRLGDVANVVEDHQPLIGDAVLTGGEDSLIVVEKFPNANTLEVTRGVEQALDKLRPGLAGIQIDTSIARPATFIDESIDNLTLATVIGAILLLAALGALLFEWRAALIAAVAIPIALMAGVLVLDLRGDSINLMVIAGFAIAIAVLVDDAVTSTAAIAGRLRSDRAEGRTPSLTMQIAEAATAARTGVVYAMLIALLPLLPFLFAEGVDHAVAEPLVVSYVLAVLASALVALTVTPALAYLLYSHGRIGRESPLVGRVAAAYRPALERVLTRPPAVIGAAAGAVVLALVVGPSFDQSLLPSFQDPAVVVRWSAAAGTSEPEMARLTTRVTNDLRRVPGVSNVGAHVGRAVLGDQIVDVNSAELWVSIDPGADYGATVSRVKDTVAAYPGIAQSVSSYLDDRVRRFDARPPDDITVRVSGPSFGTLDATASKVRDMVAGLDGVSAARVDSRLDQPNVEVEVDLEKAKRYGLKPGDVRRAAATMLAGLEVGSLFEQQKVFQVTVWSTPDARSSVTGIENLVIDTPSGGHVRMGDVADVRIAPTPTVIQRDEVSRRIDIGVDVSGRDPGSVAADISDHLQASSFPLEYHAEVIGNYKSADTLHRRMFGAGLAAAIGILLLLQAAFQSWRLAGLVFLTLPVALSGGIVAAFVAQDGMSLGAFAALLAVLAIAARSIIALVERYQALEREGMQPGIGLVARGASERLTRTLIPAIVTAVALLPLIVTGTIAGQEIAHPIAVIVLGGLVTSTLVALFLIPALYLSTMHWRTHDAAP
jgi:CzcA family heavy metal efflux pump